MKKPQPAAPAPEFPRITAGELIDRYDANDRADLLSEGMRRAIEFYFRSYDDHLTAHEKLGYRERQQHLFHGADVESGHPMSHRWRSWANPGGVTAIEAQIDRALKARDWQEVMMCAGMLCVREMIYGRPAAPAPKAAPAAKVNAARKVAKSRPAAKKPDRRNPRMVNKARNIAPPQKPLATLYEIIAQAKPLFKANPSLNREQLIAKIGRRYERLTTFAELKTLCADKTPTRHSLKQAVRKEKAAVKDATLEMTKAVSAPQTAVAWPFPTGKDVAEVIAAPPKRKRARRDPAPQAVPAESQALPAVVETVDWPKPGADGEFSNDQYVADFVAGSVKCDFAVINTEDGWTFGTWLLIDGTAVHAHNPPHHLGPVTLDADTAIRDASVSLLAKVLSLLDDKDVSIAPHLPELEKLRAWLLGFQARGVEKIEFLRKQQRLMEPAA